MRNPHSGNFSAADLERSDLRAEDDDIQRLRLLRLRQMHVRSRHQTRLIEADGVILDHLRNNTR